MSEAPGVPSTSQVLAAARRLLDEALASEEVGRALYEGWVHRERLEPMAWNTLAANRSFLSETSSLVATEMESTTGARSRRLIEWLDRAIPLRLKGVGRFLVATGGGLLSAASALGSGIFAGVATAVVLMAAAITLAERLLPRLRRAQTNAEIAQELIDRTLHEERQRLIQQTVLPVVRGLMNSLGNPRFNSTLEKIDPSGLRDLYDPEYEVPVAAAQELKGALDALTAGSIGIAGPRGVGKSTLVRAACEGRLDGAAAEEDVQGINVSAPIRYQGLDFVRYLFARVCLRELAVPVEEEKAREARAAEQQYLRAVTVTVAFVAFIVVLLVLLIVGPVALAVASLTAAVAVSAAVAILWWARDRFVSGAEEDPLKAEARRHLEGLRYLETLSQEWSAEVSAKFSTAGATIGGKRGQSLAAQAWTLPEVIENYRQFVARIADRGSVVIGIDELDKMATADDARSFLNEMKSLFDQPGVFYLVSISEDALSDFERRGRPMRDVFDSVFSEVLSVGYLSHREAESLLRRRAIGIPPPWPALFHCLAGGLPRELLRVARRAVQIAGKHGGELPTVTAALLGERVDAHERAVITIARGAVAPDGTQPLLTWLERLPPIWSPDISTSPGSRIETARRALRERLKVAPVLAALDAWSEVAGSEAATAQLRLIMELAGGWHHALSCVEFFGTLEETAFEAAEEAAPGSPSAIELLAHGQQELSVSPALSWQTVESFRSRVGLAPCEYPAAHSGIAIS